VRVYLHAMLCDPVGNHCAVYVAIVGVLRDDAVRFFCAVGQVDNLTFDLCDFCGNGIQSGEHLRQQPNAT
tara:strand:+ start:23296 stop:23505 length:210 start_codon:yes stop_codon:yes gene_type:complete